ncbi:hypothetical protein [Kushneria sp. EE4]
MKVWQTSLRAIEAFHIMMPTSVGVMAILKSAALPKISVRLKDKKVIETAAGNSDQTRPAEIV